MSTTMKIVLGIVAGIVVLCLAGGIIGALVLRSTAKNLTQALVSDPAQVADISTSIAAYTLPAGFEAPHATQFAGFSFVSYTGTDNHSHIMFFQLPAGVQLDPVEIEKQMRQTAGGQGNDRRETKVVDQIPATIAGQDVTLVVSEGVSSDGTAFREVTGMFQGHGGQALVMYEAPVSSWDQAQVDAFIASIE